LVTTALAPIATSFPILSAAKQRVAARVAARPHPEHVLERTPPQKLVEERARIQAAGGAVEIR
jgi:hypothetical protein